MTRANRTIFVALAVAGLCAGCSGDGRRELAGTVTYGGQPVPRGTVVFEPDTARGGSGPGSTASIQNGQYKTEPRFGVAAGPYRVRVSGYMAEADSKSADGSLKPLFSEVTLSVEIPAGGQFDIEIPAKKK